MIRILISCVLVLFTVGCSSTNSESRDFLNWDASQVSSPNMHIDISRITLSLQKSGGLYTLHARPDKVQSIFMAAAKAFGFQSVALEDAVYDVKLRSVFPDGGQCESLNSSTFSKVSYAFSVLTFGIFPATYTHCYVVQLELWENIDDEWHLVSEFESNTGRVDVYGGVNDIDNYQLTVTSRDESRAIEATMVDLLTRMIGDGAFE